MRFRWIAGSLLLILESVPASATRHNWKLFRANPEMKLQICYPADLLHVRYDKENGFFSLAGKNNSQVIIIGNSDKNSSLEEELRISLSTFTSGPGWVHVVGQDIGVHYDPTPRMIVTRKVVKRDLYLYTAQNNKTVMTDWEVHVDHSIKGFLISYPRFPKSRWQGVTERIQACFKSFGQITDPKFK